jgi:hypothetical protein
VAVTALSVDGRNLHATTYGRGIWRARLPFTDAPPASASIGSEIFVVAKSIDGQLLVCQAVFGQAFSDWHALAGGGRTVATPAVTAIQSSLFVFVKGLDGRIYLNQANRRPKQQDAEAFAQAFSGWFEVQGDGLSDTPPGSSSVETSVFAFIRAVDGTIHVNQAEFGHAFSGWFEMSDTTP